MYIKGRGADGEEQPFLNPESSIYVRIAIAAQRFGQACYDFMDVGDFAKILEANNAEKDCIAALNELSQEVTDCELLHDMVHDENSKYKSEFRMRIANTINYLHGANNELVALATPPPPPPPPPLKGAPPPPASMPVVARPLTESQRLIHYKSAPTESVIFASDSDFTVSAGQKVVLEAKSPEDLKRMVARLPKHGPSLAYGLVVDRPGDMTALYKAVAIRLELRLPPEIERKVADRKNAATGWLYNIVQFESGAYYTSQHDYIKPEFYAV
jgi:hypothetical protein